MAPTVPTSEPVEMAAGVSWKWTVSLGDFPVSEGWTGAYHFYGKKSFEIAVTPQSATNDYLVSVLPATTDDYEAGQYQWVLRLTLAGESYDARSGVMTITPNLDVAPDADKRSHAEKTLAMIEAEIEARITGTGSAHESYTIGTRSIDKIPLKDLQALRAVYQSLVGREQYGGKLTSYAAHFTRPQ